VNWDKHEGNISEAFHSLRREEHFCDVTLACEDLQFQAHKVVLSAGSSFFEQVLKKHKHPSPLVYLKGVVAKHMELLLDFMYCGEVSVKVEELENLLKAGEELGVKGLSNTTKAPGSSMEETQQSSLQDKEDQTEEKLQSHSTGSKTESICSPLQGLVSPKSTAAEKVASNQDIVQDNLVKEGEIIGQQRGNTGAAPPGKVQIPRLPPKIQIGSAVVKHQRIQIIKYSNGKYQVRGLLPGQQLAQLPNDKLQIFSAAGPAAKVLGGHQSTVASRPTVIAQLNPYPNKAVSYPVDDPSSEPDFSTVEISAPKTIANTCSSPRSLPPAEGSMGFGSSQILVKSEQLDFNEDVNEAALMNEQLENNASGGETQNHQIEEWKDLRKYATVVQRGARGSGEKTVYKCSLCGKIMRHGQIGSMMGHIESKHFRGAFNHICSVCQKSFDTKFALLQHKTKEHALKKFISPSQSPKSTLLTIKEGHVNIDKKY